MNQTVGINVQETRDALVVEIARCIIVAQYPRIDTDGGLRPDLEKSVSGESHHWRVELALARAIVRTLEPMIQENEALRFWLDHATEIAAMPEHAKEERDHVIERMAAEYANEHLPKLETINMLGAGIDSKLEEARAEAR